MRSYGLLLLILFVNIIGTLSVITITPQNATVPVGFAARLQCRASVDGIHIAQVTWARLNGPDVPGDRYNPIEGVLPFSAVTLSDAGGYVCTAGSGAESNSATLYLTVLDELSLISKPSDVQVNAIGNTAVLNCDTLNLPVNDVTYAWFFDAGVIPLGDPPRVITSGSQLIIANVLVSDIGSYTCRLTRVSDTSQMVSATLSLNVDGYGPPDLGIGGSATLTVSIIAYESGSRQELHCNIESLLTPTYIWTINGQVISTEEANNRVFSVAGTDILVFKDSAIDLDSGVYNCTATNKLGSAWRAYNVNIENEEDSIWGRWWMILIYCILAVMFIGALIILLIYVLVTGGYVSKRTTATTTQIYSDPMIGEQTWEQKFIGQELEDEDETGSQTWEKQFGVQEEEEQETGSQTWEHQFTPDDDDEDDY